MATKYIKFNELKENHEREYEKAYQRWVEAQWDFSDDTDYYKDWLINKFKWLDVDAVHYNVSYCQGDFASFTGNVDLHKFLDEFDKENDYFVLREAMKLQDCADKIYISQGYGRYSNNVTFDDIEWCGGEVYGSEAVVLGYREYKSVLEGMPYHEYYNLCEELMGDLHTWVKEVCESAFDDLYYCIRDDIEYQTSEESFKEWAESMDYDFEVEIEDEDIGDAECSGGSRLAA